MFKKMFVILLLLLLVTLVGCSSSSGGGFYGPSYDYENSLSNESYLELNETGFINTETNNKVNVSLDSSNAAYSKLRQLINNGYRIDKDAVNIEQILNYFNYSYVNESDEQLQSFLEIGTCPWNENNKLLSVAIKAKEYEINTERQNNFVFLLDVSGSMYSQDKLPLMINAFKILIDNLNENDRVSIVTYAGDQRVLLDGGYGHEKTKISAIISDLEASGSTAGSKGIQTAYELAAKHFIPGGNNRVFLATDGDFNVGLSSTNQLKEFISEKKETGVYLSLFGFGYGNLKSDIMDTLAQAGNGNYYYIDSILEAQKVFVSELGGTLETVAKDTKVQIEFNTNKVLKYRVLGYENKILSNEQFENSETDAGEIGAGHVTICLIEIQLKEDFIESDEMIVKSILRYKDVKDNELNKEIINELKTISNTNSDDFIFASALVEFALCLRDSEYKGSASLENVLSKVNKDIYRNDPYKNEFYELVLKAIENNKTLEYK